MEELKQVKTHVKALTFGAIPWQSMLSPLKDKFNKQNMLTQWLVMAGIFLVVSSAGEFLITMVNIVVSLILRNHYKVDSSSITNIISAAVGQFIFVFLITFSSCALYGYRCYSKPRKDVDTYNKPVDAVQEQVDTSFRETIIIFLSLVAIVIYVAYTIWQSMVYQNVLLLVGINLTVWIFFNILFSISYFVSRLQIADKLIIPYYYVTGALFSAVVISISLLITALFTDTAKIARGVVMGSLCVIQIMYFLLYTIIMLDKRPNYWPFLIALNSIQVFLAFQTSIYFEGVIFAANFVTSTPGLYSALPGSKAQPQQEESEPKDVELLDNEHSDSDSDSD